MNHLRLSIISVEDSGSQRAAIERLLRDSLETGLVLVEEPESADIVLILDITEANAYRSLRSSSFRRLNPDRCFIYSELDNPPVLLHGISSSTPKWKSWGGRFVGFAYSLLADRSPNPPPEAINGLDPDRKRFLLSFMGKASCRLRKRLFKIHFSHDCCILRTDFSYDRWNDWSQLKDRSQENLFWHTLAASNYALCPRGAGTSSVRLYEAMSIGVAPINVSDGWSPPAGPAWNEFALVVPARPLITAAERIDQWMWQVKARLHQALLRMRPGGTSR